MSKYPPYFRVVDVWAKESEKRRDRISYVLAIAVGLLLGGAIVVWGYFFILLIL